MSSSIIQPTSYPVLQSATFTTVLVGSFDDKKLYRFQVLWQLKAVLQLPKNRSIVVLVQDCDLHRGLGKIRGHPPIFGIHCITNTNVNSTLTSYIHYCLLKHRRTADYQLQSSDPAAPCQALWRVK